MAIEEYGTPANGLPPCPYGRCDGDGWIPNDDGTVSKCDCLEPRLARSRASGINSVLPKRYRGVSFDRPPVTDISPRAVQIVREWVGDLAQNLEPGNVLCLIGHAGTGLTTAIMLL